MATVLLVDDNRNIREFCKAELEADGYRVLVAADGHQAIRLAAIHAPHVVVLDLCMPLMDGLEVMDGIRAIRAHLPVIFYTAENKAPVGQWASKHVACVKKSEDLSELKEAIARALRQPARHCSLEEDGTGAEPYCAALTELGCRRAPGV
jgi:CheY-like chemotaxis protein